MPVAIDTIAFTATNPGAIITAATMASGDTATVRNANLTSPVWLDCLFRQGATEGIIRARSPLFHDFVRGITFTPSETPAALPLPAQLAQPLHPQDAITYELSGGGAEVDAGGALIWYGDLGGASARLHSWGDIAGIIKSVKPLEVDFNTSATAGAWADTVLTTTENLLHANTDYAVLGYVVDVAVNIVALKGIDTSNMRVGGPGVLRSEVTSQWFAWLSQQTGRPYIPVFNAANVGGTYLSCSAVATATAIKASLICAELAHTI